MALYLKLRSRLQSKGFTIVEMMVVVALIGLLSAVSISLISLLFQSNIRAAQSANQQSSIETFYGFLASRLSFVDPSDMGVLPDDSTPEASNLRLKQSLAPDQMMFTFKDDLLNVTCYRVMYFRQRQEIRVVSYPRACNDEGNPLVPTRTPNESFGGNKASDGFASPSNPLFDPGIDSASEEWSDWVNEIDTLTEPQSGIQTFSLVTGVRDGGPDFYGNNWPPSYPDDNTKYPRNAPLDIFSYLESGGELIPQEAGGTVNITKLQSVLVKSFQAPYSSEGGQSSIPDRFYEQKFFVGQLCPIASGGSGSSSGIVDDTVSVDDLPTLPGVDLSIKETTFSPTSTSFPSVEFTPGGFSNNEAGSFWSSGNPDEINIPKDGIYTIAVNLCFKDNSATDETSGFLLEREAGVTDTIMQVENDFRNIGEGERCLSASRTLYLTKDTTLRLKPTRSTEASPSSNISLVWQSKKGGG